jgi:5-epi-alpha-selinene synthase
MSDLDVPTLYCPFQSTVSPDAAIVDQRTVDWAYAFGLITSDAIAQRFQAARIGWLAAYLAPTASLETLQLLSDWSTWAIMWDDSCDRPDLRAQPARLARYHARFLTLLRGNTPVGSGSPFVEALWNIRQRLLCLSNNVQLYQFTRHVEEFFSGCVWEATNRAEQRSIDLETYIRMRRFTSGMYTALKVVEIADQIALPINIWGYSMLARLRELATNAVCWANDIISLGQEIQRGDIHNLIIILQRTHHDALTNCIAQGVSLHDREVQAFLTAEQAIPSFGSRVDQHIKRYVALLRSFMYGNLAWSALSGRYGLVQEFQAHVLGESHAPAPVRTHKELMRTTLRYSSGQND